MSTPPPVVRDEDLLAWHDDSRMIAGMQVVFIVGPPKCGTTWVMQSLGGHPDVAARGESAMCRALVPNLVSAFQSYNAHQVKFGADEATRFTDADFFLVLRQLLDRQLARYVAASGRTPAAVIDKTPSHAQHVDLLARLYPRAKFINCTRDVRDGAVSGWFHFQPQGWLQQRTVEEYAEVYAVHTWAAMLKAARASAARLGPRRFTEIEYAAHRDDPAREMHRLLEFIGLRADEAAVAACVEAGSFRRATGGRAAGTEDRGSFYRKGIVGDWRNHLSEEAGERILALSRDALGEARRPTLLASSSAAG